MNKSFDSASAAVAEMDKLVKSKIKKGYVEKRSLKLLQEVTNFPSVKELRTTIQSIIWSFSVDVYHLDFAATSKEKVKEFIETAALRKLTAMQLLKSKNL